MVLLHCDLRHMPPPPPSSTLAKGQTSLMSCGITQCDLGHAPPPHKELDKRVKLSYDPWPYLCETWVMPHPIKYTWQKDKPPLWAVVLLLCDLGHNPPPLIKYLAKGRTSVMSWVLLPCDLCHGPHIKYLAEGQTSLMSRSDPYVWPGSCPYHQVLG